MRRRYIRLIRIACLLSIVVSCIWLASRYGRRPAPSAPTDVPSEVGASPPSSEKESENPVPKMPAVQNASGFVPPIDRGSERITKKPFGILIKKATSPVQPERFSGYHTGTDFEIFPEETDIDVDVSAVCSGPILSKRTAGGYGGVVIQSCEYEGKPVTVVYGHLRLTSIRTKVGDALSAGDVVGVLGMGYSVETDGERKHLHLGIHKGAAPDIRGYVATSGDLSGWIDPAVLIFGSQ